ncbi:MAG: glycerol kinase GlpK [Coriobacteriaceae bacterium]|nr:glycerol kinase GlpK [Coriobacteriaceae bacterium]
MRRFVLSIDQSTQGTKAVLFAEDGTVVAKTARTHNQIINELGWVSHNPEQIMTNVLAVCRDVCKTAGVRSHEVVAFGISNQRETCLAWDRETREPLAHAVVWQCGRAKDVCTELASSHERMAERVKALSGLDLSPYFSASKMTWLLRNEPEVREAAKRGTLCLGTIDSWLIFKLSEEHAFLTEPSNACRTQLLDLGNGEWSDELCNDFGVPRFALAQVVPSDSVFGHTTLGGLFPDAIPICGVLGDSQAALAAQNCLTIGDTKATYGTGSSVMMQTGDKVVISKNGLVSSIAWDFGGQRSYVLEGNLNYTGAVISWLKDQMNLIGDPEEVESIIARANPADKSYFVPAFTGLGAPWWNANATGIFTGITRTTGRAEMVKACAECIPYQVSDVLSALRSDAGIDIHELRVDGGPTRNAYLMQMQADISGTEVVTSSLTELSAAGAAFVAGRSEGIWIENAIYNQVNHGSYIPHMPQNERDKKVAGWHAAVKQTITCA